MTKGYLLFALDTEKIDYSRLAYACAMSIRNVQMFNSRQIALVTNNVKKIKNFKCSWVFDDIIEYQGPTGMDSRSRAYDLSPYTETVLLDSDMFFLKPMNHYWDYLENYYLYISTHPQNYKGQSFHYGFYRKVFEQYKLLDVYNAWTYFKKDERSKEFFDLVKFITDNPIPFINKFLPDSKLINLPTDEAFALAAKILDIEDEITSIRPIIPITHMKSMVQGWKGVGDDWTDYLRFNFNENLEIKLGVWRQRELLHYVNKILINDSKMEVLEWLTLKNKVEQRTFM
jgi:hypothetical protein